MANKKSNLAEGIHKIKCKYEQDDKNMKFKELRAKCFQVLS